MITNGKKFSFTPLTSCCDFQEHIPTIKCRLTLLPCRDSQNSINEALKVHNILLFSSMLMT